MMGKLFDTEINSLSELCDHLLSNFEDQIKINVVSQEITGYNPGLVF